MNTILSRLLPIGMGVWCTLLACSGCKTYLEQETPMSTPSTAASPVEPIPGSQPIAPGGVTQAAPAASSTSPYIGRPLSGATQPMAEETYTGSIERFKKAYASAGAPRIALYFNRALSDEVREWVTPGRGVITGKGENVSVGAGPTVVTPGGAVVDGSSGVKVEGSADTERGVTGYTQQHVEQPARPNPEETWMWRFEDNFLQAFLKAGAKTVDRATTLRLTANASTKQEDPYTVESVKKTEMDALAKYADILVEILVTRDHASPSGYAFRATAKQIQTGVIVGSVTKTGRDYRYEKSYEVTSSSSGYELRKGSAALILENVSQELAIDLMNSMAGSWQTQPR